MDRKSIPIESVSVTHVLWDEGQFPWLAERRVSRPYVLDSDEDPIHIDLLAEPALPP